MGRDLFSKNIENIKNILLERKRAYSQIELNELLQELKDKNMIRKNISGNAFFSLLQNKLNIKTYSIVSKNINKERYSLQTLSAFGFISSIEKNSFISMSSALNIQGLSSFRDNFIFYSKELSSKGNHINHNALTQEAIDNAYSKDYRITKNIAEYKNRHIVYLTPKNTSNYGVINFNEYKISSINRSLVEMIINVQYFKSFDEIIKCFLPIASKLEPEEIFNVLKAFDLIYPYYQLIGFALERLGFQKEALGAFKNEITNLIFYTQKNKKTYKLDTYWNIRY